MNYASGNPAPLTPEGKLADKRWRYINSWWIFPSLVSFGLLGWLGFMVAALRTGKKAYWVFSGLYAALFAAFITMISFDPDGLIYELATIPMLAAWLAPTIHAASVNREYLRALAARGEWYRTPISQPSHAVQQESAPFLGVSQSDYYAPTAPTFSSNQPTPAQLTQRPPPHQFYGIPPEPMLPTTQGTGVVPPAATAPSSIHANTATVETLRQLPGVDPALASRVVAVRDARGGYRDIDDLAYAANLQPHELVRLRNHLTFDLQNPIESETHNPTQHGEGRLLDI